MSGVIIGGGTTPTSDEKDRNRVELSDTESFGIFTNILRDAGDIAGGLWKLGGSIVHDVSTGIGDLADLDPGEGEYVLDNMYNAVFGLGEFEETGSVVWNDFQYRYGFETGLLGGHFSRLYENPLSFVGDALTVATLGGAGAAKGAQIASKVGLAGDVAKTAVTAANTADDVARLSAVAAKANAAQVAALEAGKPITGALADAAYDATLAAGKARSAATAASEAAATAAANPTARDLGYIARTVKAIEGTAKRVYNPITGKVEVVSAATNPVRRFLYQDNYLRLNSWRSPYLEAKAAKMAELAEAGGPRAVTMALKAERYRKLAEEAITAGANRVYRPGYAASQARKWADVAVGVATGKTSRITQSVMDSFDRNFGKLGEEVVDIESLTNGLQGNLGELTSDGIRAPEGRGVRRAEVFDESGPTSVTRGPARWTTADGEEGPRFPTVVGTKTHSRLDRINQAIDERVDPDPATTALERTIATNLDDPGHPIHEQYLSLIDDPATVVRYEDGARVGYLHTDPDTGRRTYFEVAKQGNGQVLGFRQVEGPANPELGVLPEDEGNVLAVTAESQQGTGIGSRLVDEHWLDEGIPKRLEAPEVPTSKPAARVPEGSWSEGPYSAPYKGKKPPGDVDVTDPMVQPVSIQTLFRMRGNKTGKTDVAELAADIEANGLNEPLLVIYDPKTGYAYLGEGNHRLEALRDSGYTAAPVRVVKGEVPQGKGIKMHNAALEVDQYGWTPSEIAPNWIGLKDASKRGVIFDDAHVQQTLRRFDEVSVKDDFGGAFEGVVELYPESAAEKAGVQFTKGDRFFAIRVDGKTVSIAGFRIGGDGGITVMTDPAMRRQGLATRLYDAARERGVPVDKMTGQGILSDSGDAFSEAYRRGRAAGIDEEADRVASLIMQQVQKNAYSTEGGKLNKGAARRRLANAPVTIEDEWARLGGSGVERPWLDSPEDYELSPTGGYKLKPGSTETRKGFDEAGNPIEYDVEPLPERFNIDEFRKTYPELRVLSETGSNKRPLVEVPNTRRPQPFVYRVVDIEEYRQAERTGFFQSDGRMNIAPDEGTVGSTRSTGDFYMPKPGRKGVIVRFRNEGNWHAQKYGGDYVQADGPIPFETVDDVSQAFEVRQTVGPNGKYLQRTYRHDPSETLSAPPRPGAGDPYPRVPAKGTPKRATFEQAIETARRDRRELTPRLRDEFGEEVRVISGKVKGERSIRSKAELLDGDWRDIEDISRFRLVAEDAWDPTKAQNIIDRVEKTTGGKVLKVENSINNPMPDGSRQLRVVVEMPDGHPVEFQILTPQAARVWNATRNLRNILGAQAVLNNRGVLVGDDLLRYEKGIRLSQQLWEAVTDELRVSRGGPAPADLRRRINDFRIDVWAATTDPLLGRGLDIHSVFDNAYMPMRHRQGAKFDPKAAGGRGAMVGGPSPVVLDDAVAQAGEMAPMYYPLMDADLLPRRGEFIRKGALSRATVSDQNLQRNTGKVLEAGTYSKDPRTVWRVRAAQTARMQEHIDLLFDTVAEFGHPIEHLNDLGPGEELFAPGLVKHLQKQHNLLLDELANDPTGKGMRDLLEQITGENAQMMRDLLKSQGDIEAFAIPSVVAKRLRQHAMTKPFGEGVDILFGTPTKMWKTLTLAGRPAWMVNNLFSNVIFTKLQGGKLWDVVRQLDKRYVAKLREAIGPDALERIEGGLYSSSHSTPRPYDTDTFLGSVANWMQQNVSQSRVGSALAKKVDWVQSINSGMEDAFRRASYMTAAEKALVRTGIENTASSFWRSKRRLEATYLAGLDEASWKLAVDDVNKYLNDYNSLTPLGKNVIRPYLVPFYSFYKHAAKLLLTMPFEHPAKARLFALWNQADEARLEKAGLDPDNLPGWMKSDMLFTGRGEAGDWRFISGGGLNPFNAVMDSPLNTAHPLWKVLYEQSTGRSVFTGKEFTDKDVVPGGFGSTQKYRVDPGSGDVTAVETVKPGILEHLLQQVPQYEMIKDAIAGGQTYDTTTLIDVILGEGPVVGPDGEVLKPTDAAKQLGRLFGYTPSSYDALAIQEKLLEGKTAALEAWRERQSVAYQRATSSTGGVVVGG